MKGAKEGREVTFRDWASVHIQTKACAHLLAAPHSLRGTYEGQITMYIWWGW